MEGRGEQKPDNSADFKQGLKTRRGIEEGVYVCRVKKKIKKGVNEGVAKRGIPKDIVVGLGGVRQQNFKTI